MGKVEMNVDDYVTLLRLARRRLRSERDYRELQRFQSTILWRYLQRNGIELKGKAVLDLGSGIGGYSVEMVKMGAHVLSVDLVRPSYPLTQDHDLVIANALAIPLHCESVDFVFCASLIEHVLDPARLLSESQRVLRRGGHCYLSFPPFYSPVGGHEYSPWHYLGERRALRVTRGRDRFPKWVGSIYELPDEPDSFSQTFGTWGLYRMTIAQAKRLIAGTEFETINLSTRYLPVSAVRWPILGEVLTWHAQFLLKKA